MIIWTEVGTETSAREERGSRQGSFVCMVVAGQTAEGATEDNFCHMRSAFREEGEQGTVLWYHEPAPAGVGRQAGRTIIRRPYTETETTQKGGGGGQHDRPLGDAKRIHGAPRELLNRTSRFTIHSSVTFGLNVFPCTVRRDRLTLRRALPLPLHYWLGRFTWAGLSDFPRAGVGATD